MCRIAGIVSRIIEPSTDQRLAFMLKSMAHGGPDDEGNFQEDHVALGHRRLSIIDLSSAGHQPMTLQDAQLIISYNGEIYNYETLRGELQELGHAFKTKTDTEVILQSYQQWGATAFDRFEGIFAFSLYDKSKNKLFLVRDHIGIKPLYYFLDDKQLIFASEVRAFKAFNPDWTENENWKILFLAFGSIPHPFTTLSGVLQLPPGSYLEFNVKTFEYDLKYYFPFTPANYKVGSSVDALALIKTATQDAVKKNLISDAPLGIFLSGGIDSSLLTLLADQCSKNVNSISVNFEDASYDETPFQKLVLDKAKNVKHTSFKVTEQIFWERLDDIWKAMDQPSVDGINSYFVTRCARHSGIKAVLSGLGADEMFGGYISFSRIKWMRLFRQLPFKKAIAGMLSLFKKSWGRAVYLALPKGIGDYLFLRGIYTPLEIASQLNVPTVTILNVLAKVPFHVPARLSDVEYASLLETNIYMSNQLLKDTDYMGMWHGVEVRVPFLDIELAKKVRSIPPTIRYNKEWPKYLLTASNENVLPREIIFREKKGFTFPFALWFRKSATRFKALLPETSQADKVWDDFLSGKDHWSKCWSLAVLKNFQR